MARRKYVICCLCGYQHPIIEKPYPQLCPGCNKIYWEKPINERRLMLLQEKYDASGRQDKEPFQEMLLIIEPILHNLIASKLKSSAIYLEEEKRYDLVMDSLVSFAEKYNKPGFKITGSFVGYLKTHILNPLYNPKKKRREKNGSFHAHPCFR